MADKPMSFSALLAGKKPDAERTLSEWRVFLPDATPELSAPAPASVMKETLEKEIRKDKFEIRKIALRIRPPGGRIDLDELRVAMAGQGIEWDDELVADAIGVLLDG